MLGFVSVSYIKPISTHEKLFAVGKIGPNAKSVPNATLNLYSKCHFEAMFFLGLSWPWVGEFVGFVWSVHYSLSSLF